MARDTGCWRNGCRPFTDVDDMIGQAIRDLRHASRMILRMPALAAVIIGSLGVGIGANTIVFSWIQSVVLNPIAGVRAASGFQLVEPKSDDGMYLGTSW